MRHLLSQSAIDPALPTHLPDSTESLLRLFENGPSHKERICALAKIKHQMLSSLDGLALAPVDQSTAKGVENLFCRALLRYIRRNHENSEEVEVETRLFFHTVSLTIKHFFSEEGFKHLLAQVTDLIDSSSLRVKLALHFFTEIINTVEDNRGRPGPRCHFERHLTNEHISSMLTLANFCLEKGLLAENITLEEGPIEEAFELVAPEDTIAAALKLVRACLCFDWLGEKYNEFWEVWQMGSLVIPTKRARQATQTQFDKWLRNCQWIRLYSFLFKEVKSMELKIQVAGLLGDMSRIHMKFFKNKSNYRVYIENIVYAFSQILQALQISKNSQKSIQVALALLSNLNKLLGGSASSLLFDINQNFLKGLLQNIKNFIVYQLIAEQILNSNLLFYTFGFLQGVMKRSRFEKNKTYLDTVQDILRDICRNYEQYLRILMNSMRKSPIRISEAVEYRMDYAHLRDSLSYYDWTEIQLFLLPFRLMKPRYATTNTIYEVFIFICARVARAASLLELFKMQKWEKEVAYSMVSQSVVKVAERFGFTSFKKTRNKQKEEWEESQLCPLLPPISEHYEEEIENEEEYCHMLRLSVFIIIDQVMDMSLESTLPLSATMIKLTSLTVQLCLSADLQEKGSRQWGQTAYRQRILQAFQRLPLLCRKAYLREYERSLYLLQQTHRFLKLQPIKSRYSYAQSDLEFVDMQLQYEASCLLQTLVKLLPQESEDFNSTLVQLRLLTVICLEAQWHSIPESILTSIDICIQCVQIIMSVDPIASLVLYKQKRISDFLRKILAFLDSFEGKEQHLPSILKLLRKLIEIKCEQIREEALNKTFVILSCLLPFLRDTPELPDGLLQELELMSCQVLPKTRQKDLELLALELRELIISRKEPQRMELETTCLSFTRNQSVSNLPSFNQSDEEPGEALLQKQIPNRIQTQPVPAAESQQVTGEGLAGGEGLTGQGSSSPARMDIYDGYHREKTMSVLSRYMKQHQEGLQNPSGVEQTGDPPAQDLPNKSPFKTVLGQLCQDSIFPEQPMEIEHSHPHDYTDTINEIVHGEHHSGSAPDEEPGGSPGDEDHQNLDSEIYIPLQPASLETEEEEEVREDAENEVETQFPTIPEEGESTFSSEHLKPKEILQAAAAVIEESRDSEQASPGPRVPEVVAASGPQAMGSPKGVSSSKGSAELSQSEGKRSLMLLSSSSSESQTKNKAE